MPSASVRARLERNVGLISNIDTWGINSIPFEITKALCPRQLIVADRGLEIGTIKTVLNFGKQHGVDMGLWFGVPDSSETALHYGARVVDSARKIGGSEVMLDLEANWGRQKILDAVTYVLKGHVGVNPGDVSFAGLTRMVTVTCEPSQDWSVFPWQELYALGVAAVYIQCYGAKMDDLRDPLFNMGVALGSNAPHGMVHVMIPAGMTEAQCKGHDKDNHFGVNVGTFYERLPLTGTVGWAFYLVNDWGQPNADPTVFNRDLAKYGPLIGSKVPVAERRAKVCAYR